MIHTGHSKNPQHWALDSPCALVPFPKAHHTEDHQLFAEGTSSSACGWYQIFITEITIPNSHFTPKKHFLHLNHRFGLRMGPFCTTIDRENITFPTKMFCRRNGVCFCFANYFWQNSSFFSLSPLCRGVREAFAAQALREMRDRDDGGCQMFDDQNDYDWRQGRLEVRWSN